MQLVLDMNAVGKKMDLDSDFDFDWQEILRANNPEKRSSEPAVMLSARIAYELHRNNERRVFLSPDWFKKATKKERHQNARYRGQINHIFHFKFWAKVRGDRGVLLYNVFEIEQSALFIEFLAPAKISGVINSSRLFI